MGGLDEISDRCGRPLDNNVAERALKRTALLPKNALFYKNEHGAMVGEILLSLIETRRLNKVSAGKYRLAVAPNALAVRAAPSATCRGITRAANRAKRPKRVELKGPEE